MNVETTLEQELHAELSRLKRAVDYIEQARETVQEVQQINKDNQTKYEEVLGSNKSLKSEMNEQASAANERFAQIVDKLNMLTEIINDQQKEIKHKQKGIELLGAHLIEVQQVNKDNQKNCEEMLESNESLKVKLNEQVSTTNGRFEQIVDELSKLTKRVGQLQKKNEQQANLKWYQRLFGYE